MTITKVLMMLHCSDHDAHCDNHNVPEMMVKSDYKYCSDDVTW